MVRRGVVGKLRGATSWQILRTRSTARARRVRAPWKEVLGLKSMLWISALALRDR